MLVKNFEIKKCTILIFHRCDSITLQCYHRDPCVSVTRHTSSQKQVGAWDTQKLGNLHAVKRPARTFGLISFLIKDIYLIKRNEGEGQQRFLSCVTGSRMLQWRKSCHPSLSTSKSWPEAGAVPEGWVWATSFGAHCAGGSVGGHPGTSQLLSSPLSSITTILLKKSTILLFRLQV